MWKACSITCIWREYAKNTSKDNEHLLLKYVSLDDKHYKKKKQKHDLQLYNMCWAINNYK